ncbi:hypothetical protein SXCC_00251 [Gluconacetobacter sp. SXCC-1]|nr:hypothetical protein SXCC_00275 [Gluconacetobacter sp. SXCC-1]EGG79068.1 hypothetical protein SXCC_00251 [Gluconacetobacter sp. SXCC-1]
METLGIDKWFLELWLYYFEGVHRFPIAKSNCVAVYFDSIIRVEGYVKYF